MQTINGKTHWLKKKKPEKTKQADVTGTGINHFSSGVNQLSSDGALENFNYQTELEFKNRNLVIKNR